MNHFYPRTTLQFARGLINKKPPTRALSTEKPTPNNDLFVYIMGTFVTGIFSFTVYQAIRVQLISRARRQERAKAQDVEAVSIASENATSFKPE